MKYLYPLKFDFGEIQSYTITEDQKKFYLSTVSALLNNDQIEWPTEKLQERDILFKTIPIYHSSPGDNAFVLADLTQKWLSEKYKLIRDSKFENDESVVLIDLTDVSRDTLTIQLFTTLQESLKNETTGVLKYVFLLDRIPTEKDILLKVIDDALTKGQVILIDTLPKLYPAVKHETFKADKFTSKYRSLTPNNITKFKKKLIRRVGHFKPNKNINRCNRYFYDASNCKKEIEQLTLELISKLTTKSELFEYIVVVSKISGWLDVATSMIDSTLQKDVKEKYSRYKGILNFSELKAGELDVAISKYEGGDILILTDMVNTGASIKDAIEFTLAKFPKIRTDRILLLSVLSNQRKYYGSEIRSVDAGNSIFNVRIIHSVELKEINSYDCPLCKLNLKHDSLIEDEIPKFRSYDFWDISDSAKPYIPEPYKPDDKNREAISVIPNMVKWFEENAAYIFFKLETSLRNEGIGELVNIKVIFPDESKVNNGQSIRIENTFSGRLASLMKEYFKVISIGVPREVIDNLNNGKITLEAITELQEGWTAGLKRIGEHEPLIFIDDFHKGGSTFRNIQRILKSSFGRDLVCYFPIIDFNPSLTNEYKKEFQNIKFLNLYEFQHK